MESLYMLDTDTCIFLMRRESKKLEAKVQSVPLQQQVMSAVTFAELSYGIQASGAAKRKQNQATLDSLALHLAVLDWSQDAAKSYAEIRFDLKKRGAQLGAADLLNCNAK
jgi:tRNA(fMet)-specific endonuclease VapC